MHWAPPHCSVVILAVENNKMGKNKNKKHTMRPKCIFGPPPCHLVIVSAVENDKMSKKKTYYEAQMHVWAPPCCLVVISTVENNKNEYNKWKKKKRHTMGSKWMFRPYLTTWLSCLLAVSPPFLTLDACDCSCGCSCGCGLCHCVVNGCGSWTAVVSIGMDGAQSGWW